MPMMATELEFYLFENAYEVAARQPADARRDARPASISAYNEDYHIFQTTQGRRGDARDPQRALRRGHPGRNAPRARPRRDRKRSTSSIPTRSTPPTTTRSPRTAVKEIAWTKGRSVTFMAKYDHRRAGSSSHVHQSLWTLDGKPAFRDAEDTHGMSALMKQFLAGQLAHARGNHGFPRALRQQLQAVLRGHVRPHQGRLVHRQPHGRLPRLRRGYEGRSASNAASAGPT